MARTSRATHSPAATDYLPRLPQFALTRYLSEETVRAFAEGLGGRGRRRVFDPFWTLFTTVDQAICGQPSQAATVTRLAAATGLALDHDSGAFCRGRQRQPACLVQAAAQSVFRTACRWSPAGRGLAPARWHPPGRVFLLDGFCTILAPTAANQARYPQSTRQRPSLGDPQLHGVLLLDLATGCIVQLAIGSLHDHDAKLARPLWDCLRPGDLVIADRGFASYGLLAAAQQRGFYVLFRQHQRRLNDTALEGQADDRQEAWRRPSRHPAWWHLDLPARLVVRVTRRRLDGGEVLAANSNLPAELSGGEVLDLYHQRWQVETHLKELKVSLRLEALRAATPDLAETLLWGWVLAYNLVQCLLTEAAATSGLDRRRLSFQMALDALAAVALLPTADPEQGCNWVIAQLTPNPLPRRRQANRHEPRAVRSHHRGYPYLSQPRQDYPSGRRRLA